VGSYLLADETVLLFSVNFVDHLWRQGEETGGTLITHPYHLPMAHAVRCPSSPSLPPRFASMDSTQPDRSDTDTRGANKNQAKPDWERD
jgi:hypothetical protein